MALGVLKTNLSTGMRVLGGVGRSAEVVGIGVAGVLVEDSVHSGSTSAGSGATCGFVGSSRNTGVKAGGDGNLRPHPGEVEGKHRQGFGRHGSQTKWMLRLGC